MENETNLVRFFGQNPFSRILDALIDNIGEDFSKKELQEIAGTSKAAFFKHWPKVEELSLVKITRVFGNTKLYTLDKENALVKDLLKFETRMIEETGPKEQLAIARITKKSNS
jgi:predicted AAA+ superfamily ATPase